MKKSKVSILKIISMMMMLGVVIIFLFQSILQIRESSEATMGSESNELQTLLQKDFELSYPATPRDVVKMYSRMLKCLYSGIGTEDAKLLAMKMRELYDVDFLNENPESEYLDSISSELTEMTNQNSTMVQYYVFKGDTVQYNEVGDQKLTTIDVIYTMKHNDKVERTAEKIYLKLDDNNQWKIYGWELSTTSESEQS